MVLSNWKISEDFLKLSFYLQSCRWVDRNHKGSLTQSWVEQSCYHPQAYEDRGKTSYQIMEEETHVETVTLKYTVMWSQETQLVQSELSRKEPRESTH